MSIRYARWELDFASSLFSIYCVSLLEKHIQQRGYSTSLPSVTLPSVSFCHAKVTLTTTSSDFTSNTCSNFLAQRALLLLQKYFPRFSTPRNPNSRLLYRSNLFVLYVFIIFQAFECAIKFLFLFNYLE